MTDSSVFTPSLFLKRLVVMSNGERVYDENFHTGLNIIRGMNGTGKTTIADFIFFGLGGENVHWKEEALRCDYVYCEVFVSGQIWTLRREVRVEGKTGTDVFEGAFDAAAQTADGWRHYPFSRASGGRESYSQLLFAQLGIPDVKESGDALTVHKLLRALYVDQTSPMHSLLYADVWDTAIIREMIGDVLFGVYSPNLFEALVSIRQLNEEIVLKRREQKNLKNSLSDAGFILSLGEINAKLAEIEELSAAPPAKDENRDIDYSIEQSIADLNTKLSKTFKELNDVIFEYEDSKIFVEALNCKLKQISQSVATRNYLGELHLDTCPVCLSRINVDHVNDNVCHLCKHEVSSVNLNSSLIRLREEIKFQIQESNKLQEIRSSKIEKFKSAIVEIKSDLSSRVSIIKDKMAIKNSVESNIDLSFIMQRAELIAKKKDLEKNSVLVEKLDDLSDAIIILTKELNKFEEQKYRIVNNQKDKKLQVIREININTRDLLCADSRYEHEFVSFENVEIDFPKNTFSIDGKNNFSASSVVYLKNSICFSMFFASLVKVFMCYPRFILCDNTEDKGMQPERSQAFQRKIAELSRVFSKTEHQIILTTSMIADDLNIPEYCIGHFFTEENLALQFPSILEAQKMLVSDAINEAPTAKAPVVSPDTSVNDPGTEP